MLIQSHKINILLSLLLVVNSVIVCAPGGEQDMEQGINAEGQALLDKAHGPMASFRHKFNWKKIGAVVCCGLLALGGVLGGIGIKRHYDAGHPDALDVKDFEKCDDVYAWDRRDKICLINEESAFLWAIAHCQGEILDGCVPICASDAVPNSWGGVTVPVEAFCPSWPPAQRFGVVDAFFCGQRHKGWAATHLTEKKVSHCRIPEGGGQAAVFMIPYPSDPSVLVNMTAYKTIAKKDAMESEKCEKYANKAREIAGCYGNFTCEQGCILEGRAQQPKRTSKGEKGARRARLAKSNRSRHG